ncbi:MAG: hypothetical protein ACI4PO_08910 [Faecousia sp.]
MAAPQNFRSAFNGFNREDVAHYLEYINTKHQSQVNQLTAEIDELRAQLEQKTAEDQTELVRSLQAKCMVLDAQLEEAQTARQELEARCAALEQQQEAAPKSEAPAAPAPTVSEELETYRRAERIEREARERAELVYFQANSVLTEATAKVDGISSEITDMADRVMAQLTQLQMAVSSSKQALQDASSIMNTIRPNN